MNTIGEDASIEILENIGDSLGREIGDRIKTLPLQDRAIAIADALESLGYDAAVEPSSNATVAAISAQNCVFHLLAQTNNNICRLDLAFLRACSGANVEHIECMAKGENACRFRITERPER